MLIPGFGFSQSQIFPQIGQRPSTAFPVCGLDTFRQLIIPYDTGVYIPLPGCGKVRAPNPYYYAFTCYSAGELALLIEPISSGEDYNWELFDVTGHDPEEIFTNSSLSLIGNWSGNYGRTGARKNGNPATVCLSPAGTNDSTFSAMPILILGHNYLLLVCGYSKIQSDYFLSFTGSTAVITNPSAPQLQSVYVGCNKKVITVVTNKSMRCNSLTSDGSNFKISPGTVVITGAAGLHCSDLFDFDTLELTLSDTLKPGNYNLSVKKGSDGKILWDNCFHEVPEGNNISFTEIPSQTVSASFNYQIGFGCTADTIFVKYPLTNGNLQSVWFVDSNFVSNLLEPNFTVSIFEPIHVLHAVSNGVCSDTVGKIINLDNVLKAGFRAPETVCPKDLVTFSNTSLGNIISWNWNFGDGTTSIEQQPPAHLFPDSYTENKYLVKLVLENNIGCFDTFATSLTRLQSCSINVPNAFTPNGDGKNDYLYPLNASSVKNLEFMVFNRLGQMVFETQDGSRKWDGTINGKPQPSGTYIWTFSYSDGLSGKKISLRGASVLIR